MLLRSLAALLAPALISDAVHAMAPERGALTSAVLRCLAAAAPPSTVQFRRYESMQLCQEAEERLAQAQAQANRARNQGCSRRLQAIRDAVLQASMHGSKPELVVDVLTIADQLSMACLQLDAVR